MERRYPRRNAHQAFGLAKREGAKHYAVNDAEDRRCRADAERHDDYSRDSEQRRFRQKAHAKSQVANHLTNKGARAGIARRFPNVVDASEQDTGGATRIGWRQAARNVRFSLALDVKAQLFAELGVESVTTEQ